MDVGDPAIEAQALAAAAAYHARLPALAPGSLTQCSLHWAGMPYGWARESRVTGANIPYHVVADLDERADPILVPAMDPTLNARELSQKHQANIDYCASVWRRNSRAVAVSISAMIDATPHDFGKAPITPALVEFLCAAAGALCAKYGIDARAREACYTHAEAAAWDGYFLGEDSDCRWDLGLLEPTTSDAASMKRNVSVAGDRLRERICAYRNKLAPGLGEARYGPEP